MARHRSLRASTRERRPAEHRALERAMSPKSSTPPAPTRPKRRRLRDRLIDREGTRNEQLVSDSGLQNHLLLFDDDLRETAMALGNIEGFLARALAVFEREHLSRAELEALAHDVDVETQIAALDETLESLKLRLGIMASRID